MDDILKRYIDKVLDIQNENNRLSDSDLREIAKDIGLSEQDLQAIDQDIENTVQRANGFMAHSIWNNAVEEWKQVLILSPNRKNAQAKLAHCYLHLGDNTKARALAEDALNNDPSNTLAFEVLGAIQKTKPGISTIYTVVGTIVIVTIMLGIGTAMLIVASDGELLGPWGTTGSELSEAIMKPQPQHSRTPVIKKDKILRTNTVSKNAGGFPITLDLPPGLKFKAHLSKVDIYKDKSYYKLIGKIENQTRSEISQLQGTLTYHLKDGNTVQDVIDILPTYRAILRPSDSVHFQEMQKISNTTLRAVSLKVAILSSSPASRTYPKPKEIPYKWAGGISATQYKIGIFERHSSLGSASSLGQFHKITWEFKNFGQTIRKLKMSVTYFSEKNEQLADKFVYVTSSSAAPISQNEIRIANMIAKLPAGKFHHYELKVVDIE